MHAALPGARTHARTCSRSLTSDTATTPLAQPMPLRLYVSTLGRILKWLTMSEGRLGTGQ